MNNYQDIINEEKLLHLDWYRLYYPMVKDLVFKMTKSKEDVDDIFQDSLIVIFEKKWKNELHLTSKISTYLYGIAANKCKEYLKRNKKESALMFDDDFEMTEETNYDPAKDALIKQLELCIEKLPETKKIIVRDYYYFKYKMEAIAEKNNWSNSDSVKTQKFKAIVDLKGCLKKSKML